MTPAPTFELTRSTDAGRGLCALATPYCHAARQAGCRARPHGPGDHWIVVGRVEQALTAPGLPLLTRASDLARLNPSTQTETL